MSIAMPVLEPQAVEYPVFEPRVSPAPATVSVVTPPQAEPMVTVNGKLQENGLSETDKHFALAIHLSPFAGMMLPLLFLAPVVLWLIRKDQSRFVDDHGREMTNVLINSIVVTMALAVFSIPVITLIVTIPALAIWYVVIIISQIRAAVAASRGEYFRYPMVMRFLT